MARTRQTPKPSSAPKPSSGGSTSTYRKAVLLFDAIAWNDGEDRFEADGRGTEVELPAAEFKRLKDMGAVAEPKSAEAKDAAAAAESEETP